MAAIGGTLAVLLAPFAVLGVLLVVFATLALLLYGYVTQFAPREEDESYEAGLYTSELVSGYDGKLVPRNSADAWKRF